MKHIKRLFSTLLVLALAMTFAIPAFATTVNIADDDAESTYNAYQLLTATLVEGPGTSVNPDGEAKYSYAVNPNYREVLKAVVPADRTTDEAIIQYIADLKGDDVRTFADAVFAELSKANAPEPGVKGEKAPLTLEYGYWLISEMTNGTHEDAAATLVLLKTVGETEVTVNAKEAVPSSDKKVQDANDSTTGAETEWKNSADYDIGDLVPFQLTGTLPENYAVYEESYVLTFHDVESAGLTFDPTTVKVKYKGADVDNSKYTVKTKDSDPVVSDDGCTFEIVIDVRTAIPEAVAGDSITVEYKSKLNENAVIGAGGNPNTMYMEYSNNPYGEGTGKTPPHVVTVFTFAGQVKKVDGNNQPLAGADFTLYKFIPGDGDDAVEITAADGSKVKGTWTDMTGSGVWKKEVTGEKKDVFTFKGLDDGYYKLVETGVPAGYNAAADIYFSVTATHAASAEAGGTDTLQDLNVKKYESADFSGEGSDAHADLNDATASFVTTVMNLTGAELPSTGGMGTTLFYIVGGILVAAAVILLVTKKRVNSDK